MWSENPPARLLLPGVTRRRRLVNQTHEQVPHSKPAIILSSFYNMTGRIISSMKTLEKMPEPSEDQDVRPVIARAADPVIEEPPAVPPEQPAAIPPPVPDAETPPPRKAGKILLPLSLV